MGCVKHLLTVKALSTLLGDVAYIYTLKVFCKYHSDYVKRCTRIETAL